jgi:NAD(P)-dependent dehydrogenase (short-subunit alcohol dehydrogenase family)
VARRLAAHGHIDVVVHNAGHMDFGPAEAFTPEQLAELYDINVLSTQRMNRAALPYMRKQRSGLLVWVSSSSVAGGTPPYLSPYFAAKAGMDAIAVSYARELALWGIETSIVVRGHRTSRCRCRCGRGCDRQDHRHAIRQASLSGAYRSYERWRRSVLRSDRSNENRDAPPSRT